MGGNPLTIVTELNTPAFIVRFSKSDKTTYEKLIVAELRDNGRVLYLQGWVGEPLTKDEWVAAGEVFPDAVVCKFMRWNPRTSAFREVCLTIPRKPLTKE